MHELKQEEYENIILDISDCKHNIDDLKRRINECENQQDAMSSLTRSVDRLTVTVSTMVDEQKELKSDVKALKEAPIEKFEHYKRLVAGCVITTLIGAVLGAVLSLILIKGV